ncbi:UPF0587 protein F46B6.12 [Trichinella patagoniensis]|uniref:UPF0587 protein F46B6.12 n=1 Tax=Trichinella patagoniensis TaxID=990121 RepID=A0A0V0ZFS8_9BILA|nr:UPF0587 protein F46B6.12 [Trichinella patagoniensis]
MKPRHCENITWDDLSWRSDGSVAILPLNKRIRVSVDVLIAKLLITAAHGSHHTHFVINTVRFKSYNTICSFVVSSNFQTSFLRKRTKMPKYSLEMKILTNTVETLEPNNDNFAWQITVKCQCGEVSTNWHSIYKEEKFDIPGSRGEANFVKKCKVCGKVGSIDIIDGSISAYDAELGKAWQKVVMFECRGVKPVDFEPGGGWIVTAMSGARYENVDLSEKTWAEYDENTLNAMGGGKQQSVELFVATAHNSEIPCDRSNVETAVQRFWIVDFDPVMNKARHYDISCNSSGMHVAVHMERPFTGTVHLADRFSQCRTVVESADSFAMFFPNNEANVGCNIKEKDNRLTATLIFSNQRANLPRNAIFGNDAVDEVQCMLESTSTESNNNNSKMIYTHTGLTVIEQATAAGDGDDDGGSGTSIVQESTVHRQAHLEILRDSSPVKQVYIGETLLLSIWADYDAEGIFVENCSVTDALLEQPLLPLIINGCCEYCTVVCSVEPSIIGHFHHVPDRLQASFQAFKMADAEQLYFQCVIKFCNDWCPQVECDNGNNAVVVTRGATRFRRIVNGIEQKSQTAVYSSVETLISILPKESSTTPSQQLIGLTSEMLNDSEAQSWKFATSVVLLFALSLLVASFIVLLAYWQWKRRLANAQ